MLNQSLVEFPETLPGPEPNCHLPILSGSGQFRSIVRSWGLVYKRICYPYIQIMNKHINMGLLKLENILMGLSWGWCSEFSEYDYDYTVDMWVWAIGVIIYEMFSIPKSCPKLMKEQEANDKRNYHPDHLHCPFPDHLLNFRIAVLEYILVYLWIWSRSARFLIPYSPSYHLSQPHCSKNVHSISMYLSSSKNPSRNWRSLSFDPNRIKIRPLLNIISKLFNLNLNSF